MWELRWILLGLGVVVVGAVYLWGRRPLAFRLGASGQSRERAEPSISASEPDEQTQLDDGLAAQPAAISKSQRIGRAKIVTLRVVPKDDTELNSEDAVLALRAAGLVHGKYGIFHRSPAEDSDEPVFSVASLVEPGSFDMENLKGSTIPGMSFFMVLPGARDPVSQFDTMVQTARMLAQSLDAELVDEGGSSWSIQRERYVREQIIEYRHQLGRA